jgi:signal transduction histidine kinase
VRQELLHVIDLLTLQDWSGAKAALETSKEPEAPRLYALAAELDHRGEQERKANALLRHEVGNALSIVRANLEGIIDEVLPVTRERLASMHDALGSAILVIDDYRQGPPAQARPRREAQAIDVATLVETQRAALGELAESKRVTVANAARGAPHADVVASAHIVREALAAAIRFTPPGGRIGVTSGEGGQLLVEIQGLRKAAVAPRALLHVQGVSDTSLENGTLTFRLTLPDGPDDD